MSGHDEVELKLASDAVGLAALESHPLLAQRSSEEAATLSSVYFDTPKHKLRKAGLTLRVRAHNGQHIQTVKATGDGLIARPEWERPVAGPKPDRKALAGTPVAERLGKATLKPIFTVSVERQVLRVEHGGSDIEVALDQGRIEAAGARAERVSEVEFELKKGSATDLFALANAVGADVPLRLGVLSKSERGYVLLDGAKASVFKAESVVLDEDMTAAEAFRTIAHGCLRHMRLNEDVLLHGRDAEVLHQVRVAIRRLRSTFSLFAKIVEDPQRDSIRAELKRLSAPLGAARNLDVFLARTLPAERARHPDEGGLLNLEKQLEVRRTEAYATVLDTLNSDEWRRFVLRLVGWINAGPWLAATDDDAVALRDQPARAFAAEQLERRRRQIKKRGRHLDALAPEELHQVRIAAKKLRYGAEFFASLYPGKKQVRRHKSFVRTLTRLQDSLGDLNDIATGRRMVGGLTAAEAGSSSALFAAGLTVADLEGRTADLLAAARDAQEELVDLRPFWR